ncbi:amidophosphoribosyltransferase, chloroplastic-like [Iris pallida]|uniref:Amidophosphoribosyltransferase n=1 Tax=Iris pallida TaxID=29817 RepID=A0AAX6EWT2_IRIPA|nr:amidophosphoribosyltransferase, chloroplastic-like [Iris pallida]
MAAATPAIAGTTTTTSLVRRRHPLSFSQSILPFRTLLKPSSKIKSLSTPPAPRIARISSSYYPGEIDIDVDSDKPREECGVVGIIGDPDSARIACLALHALQHRGQEGAGIASSHSGRLLSHTGLGLVSEVFRDPSSLSSLPGHSSIGHVRYSTAGAASSPLNVQPFTAGYRFGHLAVAHNGNIVNYSSLRSRLESLGSIFNTSSDSEVVLHLIAHSKSRPFVARLVDACQSLHGAYSFVFLTHDNKMFAVRDPHGFRPLVMGRRRTNSAVVFASETCALDLVDAEYIREVNPGEIVEVDGNNDNAISTLCLMPQRQRKACIFEHIYFALPNSVVFGRAVHSSREAFGETLASESPVPDADVVIPVPDSGFFAALGYAKRSGVQFQQGLIRSHYVTRTFIQPSQELRDLAVKLKLAPVQGILDGKIVVVVDDSIVRGTTSSKIVRLIKNAGAKEVHMRIACPPIVGSCYYGVDTPSAEELISNRMDVEGLRKEIGCDSLAFLSLESLRRLLGDEAPTFCDACFSRNYPVPPIENEVERAAAV